MREWRRFCLLNGSIDTFSMWPISFNAQRSHVLVDRQGDTRHSHEENEREVDPRAAVRYGEGGVRDTGKDTA